MSKINTNLSLIALLGLVGLSYSQEQAAAPAPEATEPAVTIESLTQRLAILERQSEIDKEAAADAKKAAPVVVAGPDGFALKNAKGDWQFKLKGYAQFADYHFPKDPNGTVGTDHFELRQVRPNFEGSLGKYADFRITPSYDKGAFGVQESYIDLKLIPELKFRFGKAKSPFGLERLQSDHDLILPERGFTSQLAPNRDVGVQAFGDIGEGILTYSLGAFNGTQDGSSADVDVNDKKDYVARVFVTPFKTVDFDWVNALSVGGAVSYGEQNSAAALPSYKTYGGNTVFSYTSLNKNNRTEYGNDDQYDIYHAKRLRWDVQGTYYVGPFGAYGEYVAAQHDVRNVIAQTSVDTKTVGDGKSTITGATSSSGQTSKFVVPTGTAVTTTTVTSASYGNIASTQTLNNQAFTVGASYVLTGEDNSYKGVKPRHSFDLSENNWGAFELAVRYSQLDIDNNAFNGLTADPQKSVRLAKSYGVGLNWWLSKNVKIVSAYEQTRFHGGSSESVYNETTKKSTVVNANRAIEHVILSAVNINY